MSNKLNFTFFLYFIFFLFSGTTIHAQTGIIPTGTDTACTNGISVYQKTYGGNKDESGYHSATTADSGYVIAGQTNSFGNGGYDGLLTKLSKKGNTVWSKAIGGSGNDYLYSVRRTADDGFIACGQTKSYGNTAGDAWLVKTDASGNVQWSKKYGDGNVNGEIAYDVIQLSDGGYAFAGTHRYAGGVAQSFVLRTDNQGNVLWSKQYGNAGSDNADGILEDGNFLIVTGFYQGGSFYDGYVMKLDKSNGAVQWIKGYDAEGRSTWLGRLTKTNTGYQVTSVITNDYFDTNQQLCIWNLNTDGTLQNVRKLSIPGVWSISYGSYALADGGFIAANGENNAGSDAIICRVNANGSLAWSKRYIRTGKQQITAISASPEGGYACAGINNNPGTVADSNNVYLMRVDSLGDAGNCSGIVTTDLTVISPSFTTPVPDVVDLGNVTINNPVITVGAVSFIPVTNSLCFSCQYPIPIIPPDTVCANGIAFYQKTYGGNKDDIGYGSAPTADSGYVIAGQTNSFGNGGYDGLLTKLNKKGNTVWSKAIGGSGNDFLSQVKRTSDNGFIACGQTKSYGNAAGDAWLVKTDASGNVQWSKKYGDGNVNGEMAYDLIQLSDGGYAFCGVHRFAGGVAESFVVRTDNMGNVLWSKQYGINGSDNAPGILEDGNFLLLAGFYQDGTFYGGYVMKLDKSNGAIQWMKGYDGENRSTWFDRISKTNTGYQVFSVITDNYVDQNQQECIWNLNTDGTIQNVRKLVIPGVWTNSYGWHPLADGGFIAVNGENNAGSDAIMCRVNANGSLAWSKRYFRTGKQQVFHISALPEGGYAAIGVNNNPGTIADSNDVYVMRVDSLGNAGNCSGINTTDLTVVTPAFTLPVPNLVDLGNVAINNPVITVGVVNFVPTPATLCFYCQPKPTGTERPATGGREPHTLRVYPNPVIGGAVNLAINAGYDDRAIVSIVDLNGNILYKSSPMEIKKGQNSIRLNMPYNLQAFTNYFIQVRYSELISSVKIFVVNR